MHVKSINQSTNKSINLRLVSLGSQGPASCTSLAEHNNLKGVHMLHCDGWNGLYAKLAIGFHVVKTKQVRLIAQGPVTAGLSSELCASLLTLCQCIQSAGWLQWIQRLLQSLYVTILSRQP